MNKMASINIQKFDGILLSNDLECEGSIATKHGLFLGNLFIQIGTVSKFSSEKQNSFHKPLQNS